MVSPRAWAAATAVAVISDGREFRHRLRLTDFSTLQELTLYFAAMFGACMICHGELVRLRPSPKHLTEFYLLMSAGGALGGVLVSLVAPRVFTTFYEWNLGLLASFLVAVGGDLPRVGGELAAAAGRLTPAVVQHRRFVVGLRRGAGAGRRLPRTTCSTGSNRNPAPGRVPAISTGGCPCGTRTRTTRQRQHRAFYSGHINHGRAVYPTGKTAAVPTTYYAEHTGVGRTLQYAGQRGPLRVGARGTGRRHAGRLCPARRLVPVLRINPEVTRIARTWFSFPVRLSGPMRSRVGGDARLSLEREQDEPFDVLVLDAFAGDAIPVHLLTREAFEIYRRRLKPDGFLVVHITNCYLASRPRRATLGGPLPVPHDPLRDAEGLGTADLFHGLHGALPG